MPLSLLALTVTALGIVSTEFVTMDLLADTAHSQADVLRACSR
ncbi:hypothetical protein [Pseudomonas sp. Fl4BN1]|nr:hypothetical protein [Pseudomonas sp. Fl4BN1]